MFLVIGESWELLEAKGSTGTSDGIFRLPYMFYSLVVVLLGIVSFVSCPP